MQVGGFSSQRRGDILDVDGVTFALAAPPRVIVDLHSSEQVRSFRREEACSYVWDRAHGVY